MSTKHHSVSNVRYWSAAHTAQQLPVSRNSGYLLCEYVHRYVLRELVVVCLEGVVVWEFGLARDLVGARVQKLQQAFEGDRIVFWEGDGSC